MSSYLPIKYVEWRGVEKLVAAEVLQDDKDGYVTGPVFAVAGVARIERASDSASETHFYDNIPALVVTGKTTDTVIISASAIPLDVLAEITGNYYDPDTGAMVTGNAEQKIFALGYIAQNTDHEDVYVWRYRGVFSANDVTHITENNSTDANGQEVVFTGYETRYVFEKTGKRASAINVDVSKGLADVSSFFDLVTTPDILQEAEEMYDPIIIHTDIRGNGDNRQTIALSSEADADLFARIGDILEKKPVQLVLRTEIQYYSTVDMTFLRGNVTYSRFGPQTISYEYIETVERTDYDPTKYTNISAHYKLTITPAYLSSPASASIKIDRIKYSY